MKKDNIKDMTKGWFVGNFEPSVYKTSGVEVAAKYYKEGDYEERHYHEVATEITVVISGEVVMNSTRYYTGDIVTIDPCESTDFLAVVDSITTVVKIPCVPNDKYLGDKK